MNSEHCDCLFVYGTLIDKNLFEMIVQIQPESITEGWIFAKMYDCGNFPMVLEDKNSKVYGLIYTHSNLEEHLYKLDDYEHCRSEPSKDAWYVRKIVEVVLNNDEQLKAWTYIGNLSSEFSKGCCLKENLIKNGRWPPRP